MPKGREITEREIDDYAADIQEAFEEMAQVLDDKLVKLVHKARKQLGLPRRDMEVGYYGSAYEHATSQDVRQALRDMIFDEMEDEQDEY
jgi:predicted solute-binding protein